MNKTYTEVGNNINILVKKIVSINSKIDHKQNISKNLDLVAADIYKYLNFNELPSYQKAADEVELSV